MSNRWVPIFQRNIAPQSSGFLIGGYQCFGRIFCLHLQDVWQVGANVSKEYSACIFRMSGRWVPMPTVKMEAVCFSKVVVPTYQIA
jgi:hypothetical protein